MSNVWNNSFTIYDLRFGKNAQQSCGDAEPAHVRCTRYDVRFGKFARVARGGGGRRSPPMYKTPEGHTCPNKIISGLIQPIPHAFPMDEEDKPARSLNH